MAPIERRKATRALKPLLALCLAAAAGLALLFGAAGRADEADKGVLAGLISRVLSTPTTQVSIGSIEGALSSDATIRDVSIADRDGVWLRLDRARLIWRRTALLARRLEIDRLEVGRLEILRRPAPGQQGPQSNEPILPELPLKVEVKAFALGELALGEPVLGTAARLTASGSARLGNPSEGLGLRFEARRLDAGGTLTTRLEFVPQTEALDLTLALNEPGGGLLARMIDLPGLPPVTLDVTGQGTLDDWASRLAFKAGETIGAEGSARLRREGPGRRLGLDLAARVEGLLPALVAPVFAGTTRLNGDATFADNGAVSLSRLALTSDIARLDIAGRLTADDMLDVKVTAAAVPGPTGATRAGATEIRKLAFDGTVAGPLGGPRLSAVLAVEDARLPQGRVAKLDANLSASPSGSLSEASTRIQLVADARASGVVPTDPALARAVGDSLSLSVRGAMAPDGQGDYETLRLATPTIDLRYAGRFGPAQILGKATADLPDLARFGDVAGLRLKGAAALSADLDGVPREGRITARLDGRASRFATGVTVADNLIGGRLALAGTVRRLSGGGFGFEDLRLAGTYAAARLNGAATADRADVEAAVHVPDLRRADGRLSGTGELSARLTGSLDRPDASVRLAVSNATALGRPVPRLVVEAMVRDLAGAFDTTATLTGDVDGRPASGRLHAARPAAGGWQVDGIDVSVGSVTVRGDLGLGPDRLATGRLRLVAGDLDDLSPLALTKLAGRLDADLVFEAAGSRQDLRLVAKGAKLRVAGVAADRLDATASVADAYVRPVLDADVSIDRAVVGGEAVSSIRIQAKGSPQASDVTVRASAGGFDLDGRGRLIPGDRIRFEIGAFSAQRGGRRLALARPATLTFAGGGVDISNLAIQADGGQVTVEGRAGSTLDLTVGARAVPLSAAEILLPSLGVSGTLDGEARLTGPVRAPTGDWRLRVSRLVVPQTRSAGLPALDVTASGRLDAGRTSVDGTVVAGAVGSLRLSGDVSLGASGTLDLSVRGRVDAALANIVLAAGGRQLVGRINLDFRIQGTLAAPQVNGAAELSGGSYADAELGLRLDNLQARVAARGEALTIERASATTRNGGSLSASGRVAIDPQAGFPGSIRITGRRADVMATDIVAATADLALDLSGPLARDPRVSGRVNVVTAEVSVPDRLPTMLRPIEGTRHVRPTRTAAARLALERKKRAAQGGRRPPPFDAALDLVISAPSRVFVRGRGLDAELGGQVRFTGTLASPVATGAFDLRRGRLAILGTRLDFTRGRLSFTGGLTPELDLTAETRAADLTARVQVTGPASQPQFAFTSDPTLPQDEVLSRILFAKASGGLSAFQALQLAQAAAQFSGGGDSTFERLRRSLGVDNLHIQFGAGGPSVGLSRAISDRVTVGVKAGATPEQSGVSVDIDVTRRVRVQGEVGAGGQTAIGVGAEWEY